MIFERGFPLGFPEWPYAAAAAAPVLPPALLVVVESDYFVTLRLFVNKDRTNSFPFLRLICYKFGEEAIVLKRERFIGFVERK